MEGFLIIAGFLVWLLVVVALVCAMAYAVLYGLERLIVRRERLVRSDERRNCGNALVGHSWWFSEDAVTMRLLAEAGNDMMRGVDPLSDINVIRERWREARKKTEAQS